MIFGPAEILLPRGCALSEWSVVACDQFTSEPEYWQAVEEQVGGAPSALRLIVPEAALKRAPEAAIAAANAAMRSYLEAGLFQELPVGYVYLERTLRSGAVRRGLVCAVDLDCYDYAPGSQSAVRATEGTVAERLPVRVRVREHAPLELPHAMLLLDDPEKTVIEPLAEAVLGREPLYDFDLMQQSGHLRGWAVPAAAAVPLEAAFQSLNKKAEAAGMPVIAVGDGNHSLAAAKLCWEARKATLSPEERETHPASRALVELVNLHDPGLTFEPIHRVAFGVEPETLVEELRQSAVEASDVAALQNFLDSYLREHGGTVDYIHGEEAARRLGAAPDAMAFLLPPLDKGKLFKMVKENGVLPRKAFSMGEAWDKRFYLEARRIGR